MSTSPILKGVAIVLGVMSIILNTLVGVIVIKLMKGANSLLGFKFIILTIIFDMFTPTVGIMQEVLHVAMKSGPMENTLGCQILGFFHNFIPIGSSCCIAIFSLERYMVVHAYSLPRGTLSIVLTIILGITFILAIITGALNQFEYTSSRLLCMSSPNKSLVGGFLYHFMIVVLSFNTLIIIFSYLSMLNKRKKQLEFDQSVLIQNNSLNHNNLKAITRSRSTRKADQVIFIKTISFISCHVLLLLPSISIMIYHSVKASQNQQYVLPYALSLTYFFSLFSLALINPILLLFLQNKVYAKFKEMLTSLKKVFGLRPRKQFPESL